MQDVQIDDEVVKKASKKNVPGTDVDVFICTNDKFREAETTPSTVSMDCCGLWTPWPAA